MEGIFTLPKNKLGEPQIYFWLNILNPQLYAPYKSDGMWFQSSKLAQKCVFQRLRAFGFAYGLSRADMTLRRVEPRYPWKKGLYAKPTLGDKPEIRPYINENVHIPYVWAGYLLTYPCFSYHFLEKVRE